MNRLVSFIGALPVGILAVGIACASLLAALNRPYFRSSAATIYDVRPECIDLLGDNPIRLSARPVTVDIAINHNRLHHWAQLVATQDSNEPEESHRARLIHVSRLWKFQPDLLRSSRWLEKDQRGIVRRVLITAPAFVPSWRGLDITERANGELSEHRDQLLSALAELGVPLDASIAAPSGEFVVRDLLGTSLNEFHLKQKELEWTAVAYAHYLPPQTHWRNRFGEEYSFDQLAAELMSRPLSGSSCQGIHLLTSLTTILLCDDEFSILSSATRDALDSHLHRYVNAAVKSQRADGSWPLRWAPEGFFHEEGFFTPEDSLEGQVIVLGHLLEWFHWLPEPLKPPHRTVTAGTAALWQRLNASPPEMVVREFCPYTHAIAAVFLAASTDDRVDRQRKAASSQFRR